MRRLREFFFDFEGRLDRKGFWLGVASCFAAALLVAQIGDAALPDAFWADAVLIFPAALCLYPLYPLSVRRLHDRDKSPAWLLTAFIPIIGPLWRLLELGFLPGSPGENRYGPAPRRR